MKRKLLFLSFLTCLTIPAFCQSGSDFFPPTNLRNASDYLPGHVDLIWSPPSGWVPSRVDRWYEYDRGILGDNAIGSCPGCPVEVAIRWDSGYFSNFTSLYLTKIRFVLRESALDHALRVYQVHSGIFDTLFNYPLTNNLVYYQFDTLEFSPITVDQNKEFWVSLWVSDMGPGYPLAVGLHPAVDGYSNMIKIYNYGYWQTLLEINPELDYPWNLGAYFETPDDITYYPIFNVFRSIDGEPFEKIHEGNVYDTVFHDNLPVSPEFVIKYYVNSVYINGNSVSSDTLQIWLVNMPESEKNRPILVYPNPAKDFVTINPGTELVKHIDFININGEIVLSKRAEIGKTVLDIRQLPPSLYIIKVTKSDGVYTSKLLIYN